MVGLLESKAEPHLQNHELPRHCRLAPFKTAVGEDLQQLLVFGSYETKTAASETARAALSGVKRISEVAPMNQLLLRPSMPQVLASPPKTASKPSSSTSPASCSLAWGSCLHFLLAVARAHAAASGLGVAHGHTQVLKLKTVEQQKPKSFNILLAPLLRKQWRETQQQG